MKALLSLAVALTLMACSTAQAARVAVTTNGNTASVFLKGDALNGNFDSVGFAFNTAGGAQLLNVNSGLAAGVPRPAGEAFTYRNRVLDADPLDGGLGWSILGQVINANSMTWGGGPLGETINTGAADGPGLFLANLHFNGPAVESVGTGSIQLLRAGEIVFEGAIRIPEPAALGLGSFALIGIAGLRRRLSA